MRIQLTIPSPLGLLTLSSDGDSLTGLDFHATPTAPEPNAASLPVFQETQRWLDLYFAGSIPDFLPPLAPAGTPFQQLIWQELQHIPYGQCTSYGSLARRAAAALGREQMSARAVGSAVGRNPIPILIPCHRVIGVNGALTGFTGGLDIKKALLRLEGVLLEEPKDRVPDFQDCFARK